MQYRSSAQHPQHRVQVAPRGQQPLPRRPAPLRTQHAGRQRGPPRRVFRWPAAHIRLPASVQPAFHLNGGPTPGG